MFGLLRHFFVPHKGNNHRAKILHHTSLFVIIFLIFGITFVARNINQEHPEVLGISYSIAESDLINLVNQQRAASGLAPLTENPELDDAARRKAADMFQKNYWAHFAPDGSTSPWGFIRAAGYNYQFAGENLAKGFTDASSVVNAWMNSETHKENILSNKYKDIGFAIVPGNLQGEDTVLVVQMFGSTASENIAVLPPAANVQTQETVRPEVAVSPSPIIVRTAEAESAPAVVNKPKIDASVTSRAATSAALIFIGFGFLLDLVIVERKKIPRVVGHNLDHVMLILIFILFVVLLKGGVII